MILTQHTTRPAKRPAESYCTVAIDGECDKPFAGCDEFGKLDSNLANCEGWWCLTDEAAKVFKGKTEERDGYTFGWIHS